MSSIRYGPYYLCPLNLQRVVSEIGFPGRLQAVQVRVERVEAEVPHRGGDDLPNDTVERSGRRAAGATVCVRRRLMMVVELLFLGVGATATTGRHF